MSPYKLVLSATVVGLLAAVQPASAQQMGRSGYNFPSSDPSLAAQFEFQRNQANSAAASSAAGLAALNQYVTNYNSSSTSIGNMNNVTQTLSGGSNGSVGQSTDQASNGNQGSSASTDTSLSNQISNALTPPASSQQQPANTPQ